MLSVKNAASAAAVAAALAARRSRCGGETTSTFMGGGSGGGGGDAGVRLPRRPNENVGNRRLRLVFLLKSPRGPIILVISSS